LEVGEIETHKGEFIITFNARTPPIKVQSCPRQVQIRYRIDYCYWNPNQQLKERKKRRLEVGKSLEEEKEQKANR